MSTLRYRAGLRAEQWLVTAAIRADRWAHRGSWRLGRAAARGIRRAHEVLLALTLGRGGQGVASAGVGAAREGLLRPAPGYPGFTPPLASSSARVEALVSGRYVLDTGAVGPLADLSWLRDPHGDVSLLARLRFHALEWVEELLEVFGNTGLRVYLDTASVLTDRWIDECLWTEREPNVWSDHATALRAIVLCRLWTIGAAAGPMDPRFATRILGAVERHGRRLAHDAFYRPDHNHGVSQAYALLALGLLFPALPDAPEWTRLGRERLEAQMADNVSDEGLHREHSPYYHFYVLNHFEFARALANDHGVSFSQAFSSRLAAMAGCGQALVKPDGCLAALGDTSRASPVLGAPRPGLNLPRSAIFADAGCAVLRQGNSPGAHVMVAARLETFPTAHVHRDVGTIELWAYGSDLIVDAGGPYGYRTAFRTQYFEATRAHNTIVVDDASQQIGQARVLHWRADGEVDALVIEHTTYPGVQHRRALVLVDRAFLLVADWLTADRSHEYAQLFHLAPELCARMEGHAVLTSHAAGKSTVRLLPLIVEGMTSRLVRGQEAPPQGWVCAGEHRAVPAFSAEFRTAGSRACFVVAAIPSPPGSPPRGQERATARLIDARRGGPLRVDVELAMAMWTVTLDPSGVVTAAASPRSGAESHRHSPPLDPASGERA